MIVNRNRTFALAAALSAALAAAGCGNKASSAQSSLKGSAMVSAALNLATGVDHVSLTITGPENRAAQPLNKVDDTHYQVTITGLTPGSGYTFSVQGFDASNSVVLGGQSANVTIVAGQTAQVPIILHEIVQPTGPTAKLPVLDGLSASAAQVEQNTDVAVSVTAHSPESHTLAYQWSDSCGGSFADGLAPSTTWHSPSTNTVCQLSVRIADSANSTSVTGYLVIHVGAQTGDATVTATVDTFPIMGIGVIDEFVIFEAPAPANLTLGITADIAATASDPDGSAVTYAWTSSCDKGTGSFSPNASTLSPVTFHNDDPTAVCTLTLTVSDTSGQTISGTIDLAGYRCANVTCAAGQACDPADGQCKTADLCAGVTCTSSDLCHAAGTCDPASGTCSVETAKTCPAGQTCDLADGQCKAADLCAGVTCTASDLCHVAGTCDPASGTCSAETAKTCPAGQTCDLADGACKASQPTTTPLLSRHIFIDVANKTPIMFPNVDSWYCSHAATWSSGWAVTDPPEQETIDYCASHSTINSYFIKADGGGLNETHIAADAGTQGVDNVGGPIDLPSAVSNPSGDIYLTNTGGRGSDNDLILLVGVQGPIRDDFSLRIQSSGYTWTAAYADPPNMGYNPTSGLAGSPTFVPDEPIYLANALDETFHKSDFIYGPQTTRPGPGPAALSAPTLPMYHGQNTGDTSTAEYLFFVDLKAGNIRPSAYNSAVPGGLVDNGAVKVHYSFTGLDTVATFNTYGWVASANQGQGISFSNSTTGGSSDSGLKITYTGP